MQADWPDQQSHAGRLACRLAPDRATTLGPHSTDRRSTGDCDPKASWVCPTMTESPRPTATTV
eukprot:467639-Alexandrium_andersonii.AAC.1